MQLSFPVGRLAHNLCATNPEETLHPCFVASMHYADRVQYLLDILLQGSPNEKQQLLNGKEVTALGEAIERCKETEEAA